MMVKGIPGSVKRVRTASTTTALVLSVALSIALASAARALTPPHKRAPHDIHLSYSRMVVDGANVSCRVRLFKDDIQRALQSHGKLAAFTLSATPASDSLFAAYLNTHLSLTSGGRRLVGRVVESALDQQVTDEPIWSYLVVYSAPAPITSFSLRVGLLFDLFSDQRNIVTVVQAPGEKRRSLYFAPGDTREQVVTF